MEEQDIQLSTEEWEKVGYTVAKISEARKKLSTLREQRAELRKLWSTFKYHNHRQPWYVEMIYRLGVDLKDANRYEDELEDRYIEYILDDPEYQDLKAKQQGMKIYNTLERIKRDIADEVVIVGENVMDLWELGIPLKTIAKAYGASENTTYIFITRQKRFKTRRDHPESPLLDTKEQQT